MKTQKEFYTFDEVLDKHVGKRGTPQREDYNIQLELSLIGQKVRELREAKHYTQKQLGELIGVQAAQICKIEKGQNLTISNVSRIFRAMGMDVQLLIGKKQKQSIRRKINSAGADVHVRVKD